MKYDKTTLFLRKEFYSTIKHSVLLQAHIIFHMIPMLARLKVIRSCMQERLLRAAALHPLLNSRPCFIPITCIEKNIERTFNRINR